MTKLSCFIFFVVLLGVLSLTLAQDGKCNNGKCPSGQCCSKFGYCGTGKDYCGCFPGDALVEVSTGEYKLAKHLQVGDEVASMNKDNVKEFQAIYAFGHKDPTAIEEFVKLEFENRDTKLELTSLHFIPSLSSDGNLQNKRAKDVQVGDVILLMSNTSLAVTCKVSKTSKVISEGLYNPYTMSGNIIVNGVVASSHSEWFLDGVFDALGLTKWLPVVYQAVLSPARLAYTVLGKANYKALYDKLDVTFNIAETGTKYGGAIATTLGTVGVAMGVAAAYYNK